MVFLLVLSVFNYFLFRTIRSNILETYEQSVSIEVESIAFSMREDLTEIPLTKGDQPIQVWFNSLSGSQKTYERIDFPEDYSEFFLLIQDEGYSTIGTAPTIIEIDDYTLAIATNEVLQQTSGTVSLVLAKSNLIVYAQIKTIGQWMIVANLGAAVLSLILALFVSRFTLKPIQALIDKAKSIKASEEMERLPVSPANDELTELSNTINQMIERIESSIKTQNQFFTSAAHELRTPLANMLAELELRLSQEQASGDKALLESQREEVVRLKYVVQDFLLMSQLKSDTLNLHLRPFRLDDLLYDVLEKMGHSIEASTFDVNIFIDTQTERLTMVGDSIKMESILVNLIQNALKYGDNTESIKIKIEVIKNDIIASFENKIDIQRQIQSGNKLGLWICGQLSEKQGFSFTWNSSGTHFIAQLDIPINAHS